ADEILQRHYLELSKLRTQLGGDQDLGNFFFHAVGIRQDKLRLTRGQIDGTISASGLGWRVPEEPVPNPVRNTRLIIPCGAGMPAAVKRDLRTLEPESPLHVLPALAECVPPHRATALLVRVDDPFGKEPIHPRLDECISA